MDELLETMPTISDLQLGKFVGGGGNYSYEAAARMAANGRWRGGYIVGMGYITSMYELDEVTVTGSRGYNSGSGSSYGSSSFDWQKLQNIWAGTSAAAGAMGTRAGKILDNRYSYTTPGTTPYKDIIVRTPYGNILTNSNALRGIKSAGKFAGIAGDVVTLGDVGYEFSKGNSYTGSAKLGIAALQGGLVFIPGIGWALSLGITGAEIIWGEDLYKYLNNLQR